MTAIHPVTPTDFARKVVRMLWPYRRHAVARAELRLALSARRKVKGTDSSSVHNQCERLMKECRGLCISASGN